MAFDFTQAERLEIGDVDEEVENDGLLPFGTSCCEAEFLGHLWAGNALRGANRPIPGVPGVDPRTAVIDETRKLVAGWIYGTLDWDGDLPATSVRATLQANVKRVVDDVLEPVGATRTARLWLPDGTSRDKPVQVKDWVLTMHTPSSARWVLDLNFTEGIFEL